MPLLIDEHQYDMQWRDVSFTRPWQLHRLGNPNLSAGRLHYVILDVGVRRPDQPWNWPPWIILSPADLLALTDILRHAETQLWRADKELQHCFHKIAHCVAHYQDGNFDSYLMIYINEMLRILLDQLGGLKPSLNRELSGRRHTVELFARDIDQNPDSMREAWTLDAMAERCGLGRSSFCRYFKDLTNMTPLNYLVRCRVDQAAKMLAAHPELSITDVAFGVGFNSSQYFANVFRHFKKCSPREWRQRTPVTASH
jgi:AraC family L-rhamnose operon regulatory protein RhaS